jgi:hypothetical protein
MADFSENDELFVMAESLLSVAELETMYFKFLDIDLEPLSVQYHAITRKSPKGIF